MSDFKKLTEHNEFLIEHNEALYNKIEKLQAQLKKAEKILATLRTRESHTTMKSNCWHKAVEYFRDKELEK